MPGEVERVGWTTVTGWAKHPSHDSYQMTVHASSAGRIVKTVVAEHERSPGIWGFVLELPRHFAPESIQVLLAETDEFLNIPGKKPPNKNRMVTIEEILNKPGRRTWISGECFIDAENAGYSQMSIVDLLCRDFLGRPADIDVIGDALVLLSNGLGLDGVRKSFVQSAEYQARIIPADSAPGAIFSTGIVKDVAHLDLRTTASKSPRLVTLSNELLNTVGDETFIIACYAAITDHDPAAPLVAGHLKSLKAGATRIDIVKEIIRLNG